MKKSGFYLVVNLYQEKVFGDVLIAMTAAGVKDVLSLSGANETRRLPHTVPIFAGFKGLLGKTSPISKVLTAYIEEESMADEMLSHLKAGDVDLIGDDLGSLVVIPAHVYYSKDGS